MNLQKMKRSKSLLICFTTFFILILSAFWHCGGALWQVSNPYAGINWQTIEKHKANLHTHSSTGGTEQAPAEVIDLYRKLGYSVIALTDHDTNGPAETTWPWTDYSRNPAEIGMVAIQGNEISRVHHIGSHFNDYGNPDAVSEDTVLTEIGKRGGLALFHHPGRYKKGLQWYTDKYRAYDHLLGQEVINRNNRYPQDRANWDSVLSVLMPGRPVWGFASDDMHEPESDMGYGWVVLLIPELNEKNVREAMRSGRSFFVHSPQRVTGSSVPEITSISVDNQGRTISLTTAGHDSIRWIADGQRVQSGVTALLDDLPVTSTYIRAEVFRSGNVMFTQPFGLNRL